MSSELVSWYTMAIQEIPSSCFSPASLSGYASANPWTSLSSQVRCLIVPTSGGFSSPFLMHGLCNWPHLFCWFGKCWCGTPLEDVASSLHSPGVWEQALHVTVMLSETVGFEAMTTHLTICMLHDILFMTVGNWVMLNPTWDIWLLGYTKLYTHIIETNVTHDTCMCKTVMTLDMRLTHSGLFDTCMYMWDCCNTWHETNPYWVIWDLTEWHWRDYQPDPHLPDWIWGGLTVYTYYPECPLCIKCSFNMKRVKSS